GGVPTVPHATPRAWTRGIDKTQQKDNQEGPVFTGWFRMMGVLGDPAPPASWPRRGFGGDGKGCRKPKEISMSKPVKRRSATLYKGAKKAIRKGTAQAPALKL